MSQSLTQQWTHIIFSTKNRHPYLRPSPLKERVHEYMAAICRDQKCHAVIIGGTADHVHMLVHLHKNIALSAFIEQVKKSSSLWIKKLDDGRNGLGKFYWQSGYAAFSVSQSQIDLVRQYIINQEEHHKYRNFQDELRKFLGQHHVDFDERYLWG